MQNRNIFVKNSALVVFCLTALLCVTSLSIFAASTEERIEKLKDSLRNAMHDGSEKRWELHSSIITRDFRSRIAQAFAALSAWRDYDEAVNILKNTQDDIAMGNFGGFTRLDPSFPYTSAQEYIAAITNGKY